MKINLYWDLQGSETPGHAGDELYFAVDDIQGRLAACDIRMELPGERNAVSLLRMLQQRVLDSGRRLLLLVDEAEALMRIARHDRRWLMNLHELLVSERQRTIVASTRLLSNLNESLRGWRSMPERAFMREQPSPAIKRARDLET